MEFEFNIVLCARDLEGDSLGERDGGVGGGWRFCVTLRGMALGFRV